MPLDLKECPGHFGHIKLEKAVYHVGYVDVVAKVLACVCESCGKLRLNPNNEKHKLEIERCKKIMNPVKRLNAIYKMSRDIKKCGF